MKTQRFLMAIAAIAALSMSSCTQEEELLVSNNNSFDDPNAVLFGTYTGQAPQSRGAVLDNKSILETSFGVYAYYTGTNNFVLDGGNDSVPNFMCNQEVTWAGTLGTDEKPAEGSWTYSPVKYWPNNAGEKVSFFAYAPYRATTVSENEGGITSLPTTSSTGDPELGYTLSEAPDKQLDILYSGDMLNLVKQNVDQKVQFNFKHAMSRIGFKRVIEVDEVNRDPNNTYDEHNPSYSLTNGTTVTITKVTMTSTEFYKSGSLNLRTGEWNKLNRGTEAQSYILDKENFDEDGMIAVAGTSETPTQLNDEDSYLMIFPTGKDKKIPVDITVEFNVTTEDNNLPNGKSQITSQVTTSFEFDFIQGKFYNFVLHIGLTSVKLDAEVTAWDHKWGDSNSSDAEVVVNTPNNNTVSLIYDANGGVFSNGSSQYIITSYVGNWNDTDTEATEHNDKTEARFKVKKFNTGSFADLTWVKASDSKKYQFNGWTETPTNHESVTNWTGTVYNDGDYIFVEKTNTSASRTIYAWWPKQASALD